MRFVSERPSSRSVAAVLLLAGFSLLVGCDSGPVFHTVTGKVTFEDAPVAEGTITFEDPATGNANSVDLDANGGYSLELTDGDYVVCVTPLMVFVPGGEMGPGGEEYKEVDNIPRRYLNSYESDLKATVSADATEHDFNMTQ